MLDVVAAGAAAAVEAFAVLHPDADGADGVGGRNLVLVDLAELALIVSYDAAVVGHDVEVGVFLVDDFLQGGADLVIRGQEPDFSDDVAALGVLHRHRSRLLVDCQ